MEPKLSDNNHPIFAKSTVWVVTGGILPDKHTIIGVRLTKAAAVSLVRKDAVKNENFPEDHKFNLDEDVWMNYDTFYMIEEYKTW